MMLLIDSHDPELLRTPLMLQSVWRESHFTSAHLEGCAKVV